jgi:hypothetical protein
VVVGFQTITKGSGALNKVKKPNGWIMVTNSAKGDYNNENLNLHVFKCNKDNVIDYYCNIIIKIISINYQIVNRIYFCYFV